MERMPTPGPVAENGPVDAKIASAPAAGSRVGPFLLVLVLVALGLAWWSQAPHPALPTAPAAAASPSASATPASNALVEKAWQAYRSGEKEEARRLATQALEATEQGGASADAVSQAAAILELTKAQSPSRASPGPGPEIPVRLPLHPLKTRRMQAAAPPPSPPAPSPSASPEATPSPQITPQLPEAKYPRGGPRLPDQLSSLNPPPALPPPSGDFAERAREASGELDRLMRQGDLVAEFEGTGLPGDMAEMYLENRTSQTLQIRLVPGMILQPPTGHRVQPLLVQEDTTVTLIPGQSTVVGLDSYCMDSRVPAPAPGEPVNYRFNPHPSGLNTAAVRVLEAGKTLESQGLLHPVMPAQLHRRAVTQIAVWKALGQPVEERHLRSAMGNFYLTRGVRESVLKDVDLVLQQSRRS